MDKSLEIKRLDLEYNLGAVRNNILQYRKQLLELEINKDKILDSLAQNERKEETYKLKLSEMEK